MATIKIFGNPDEAKKVNATYYFNKHRQDLRTQLNKKLCVYLIPKCSLLKSVNNKPLLYVGDMDEKLAPEWAAFLKQEGAVKAKCLCQKADDGSLSMKIRSKTFKKGAELIELLAANGITAEFVAKLSKDDSDTDEEEDSEAAPQDSIPQQQAANNNPPATAPVAPAAPADTRKTLDDLKKQIEPALSGMAPLGKEAMNKKAISAETAKKAEELDTLLQRFDTAYQSAPDNIKLMYAPLLKNIQAYKGFWAKVVAGAGQPQETPTEKPNENAINAKNAIFSQRDKIEKLFAEMEQLLGKK